MQFLASCGNDVSGSRTQAVQVAAYFLPRGYQVCYKVLYQRCHLSALQMLLRDQEAELVPKPDCHMFPFLHLQSTDERITNT